MFNDTTEQFLKIWVTSLFRSQKRKPRLNPATVKFALTFLDIKRSRVKFFSVKHVGRWICKNWKYFDRARLTADSIEASYSLYLKVLADTLPFFTPTALASMRAIKDYIKTAPNYPEYYQPAAYFKAVDKADEMMTAVLQISSQMNCTLEAVLLGGYVTGDPVLLYNVGRVLRAPIQSSTYSQIKSLGYAFYSVNYEACSKLFCDRCFKRDLCPGYSNVTSSAE